MAVTMVDVEFGEALPTAKIKVPKLHRVVYSYTIDGVPAQWQISYKDYIVNEWLRENCKHSYYHSPGYLTEKFIEFECDQDAVLFALRWVQ